MKQESGFSLIELMVAMSIGIVLIGGAIYVYDEARSTLNINDTLARMQENARWALDVIEPDIRLAGYWGRHTNGVTIDRRAGSANPLAVAVTGDCDTSWAIDVQVSLAASNNADPGLDCIDAADHRAGTDTLQLRHASGRNFATAQLEAGRIYVRTHETGEGSLFAGAAEPPINDGQNNALVAHVYHVRPYTIAGDSLPSLRRQGLTTVGGTPTMIDQEVISGIEDLQVQFGIDRNDDGAVDRYVDPDNAVLATNPRIRAVRVWLRMRADRPEPGFNDTRTYTYADQQFTPAGAAANFRRLLVSRTIFLRNESIREGEL
ncbi:MAG: PilW family protein [Gammaproteobacteria bacterium]|nr:PilW family protein [Gammaproteobacteria bacterium]NNM20314.1 prepilin-type N-terminal cleavage/methylation domain-containing protein [Gammaproteobacteria bacterium]